MSYLVLARKYRPQRFADLVGQEHVARTLSNAITANRVHHAFLFTGARGVGKTSAARILARALTCAKGPTAEPCGECDFCQEVAAGRSVDVIEIDAASNTKVEETKAVLEGVRYQPARARVKVYIVDEVHMLSPHSFNALLKTLEEPPPHAVFILATTEVHKIPVTILSRCQRYDFKLIPTPRLLEHLAGVLRAEGIKFEEAGLRLLARQAAGSVRDSLSLLDQVIAYVGDATITRDVVSEVLGVADRSQLFVLARAVLGRDPAAALRALAAAAEKGLDLAQLSRAFLELVRDIEVVSRVPEPGDLVEATADELAELKELAGLARGGEGAGTDLLGVLFDRWARAVDESARSTAPRLLLEMAVVDLCQAEPLEPIGDLLDRLESLEARLGSGAAPLRRDSGPAPSGAQGGGGAPRGRASGPSAFGGGSRASAAPDVDRGGANGGGGRAAPAGPAPETVPAPSEAPRSTPVGPEALWQVVRDDLEQRRPRIGALLAHAQVLRAEEGRLVLAFSERVDVDAAEKSRGDIEQAIAKAAGATVRLIVEHAVAQGRAGVPLIRAETAVESDQQDSDRRQRETEARQHPMIQKAQDLFGASIREIKI